MLTIVDALSTDDLLVQAAEEASELVQALTKYYRAMHGTNPTPITVAEAKIPDRGDRGCQRCCGGGSAETRYLLRRYRRGRGRED